MPERRLSAKELSSLEDWLIEREMKREGVEEVLWEEFGAAYLIGESKEPLILHYSMDLAEVGEADVYYPTGLEDKLSESGVIFERRQVRENEQRQRIDEANKRMPIGEFIPYPEEQV